MHARGQKVQIEVAGKLLDIGTSHLESLADFSYQREEQLNFCLESLHPRRNAILLGDLNLLPFSDGPITLPEPWRDAWLSIAGHTEENGLTWDEAANVNVTFKRRRQHRPDRVLCKLQDFVVEEVAVVGRELIGENLMISDHFGVFMRLSAVSSSTSDTMPPSPQASVGYTRVPFERPKDWKRYIG